MGIVFMDKLVLENSRTNYDMLRNALDLLLVILFAISMMSLYLSYQGCSPYARGPSNVQQPLQMDQDGSK